MTEYIVAQNWNRHRCEHYCNNVAEYVEVIKKGNEIVEAKWCCEKHKTAKDK